ncbi:RagB/SusD family nutrient uptake outer membrane protein [Pontibacter qinzhouensis]|uniref:RagB/SusD family nutrient uptake outer membrane protein n=1 Tax=Pontibacter qinzhouensis TaxID=2603253 RepID=A0A5C8K251_9BACT|nr:RagB/SusD family nutrient uptake outer membrane protein [Pontibacter qinzhouensis]TXK44308.1 RagB/SusD family nutrient uptake outer membrane protein [Pontibacter qinzhouensis]
MKNKLFRSIARVVPVVLLGLSILSCKDMFEIEPETTLDIEKSYQNVYDADAAVIGIYGKFLRLAEANVVLNELRADLMNVTPNAAAHADLMEVNYHTVTEGNKYADPRPYYEVILNCNDVLHNFRKMVKENKITQDQFNYRYSDIVALRSWVYLQLGIHFGSIPYVTNPLANVNELKSQAAFPRIEFETLLDSLINFTEKIPHKGVYPEGTSLLVNIDGYNTRKFFINKRLVLGDLHLWKGNYTNAARHYRVIMETASDNPGNTTRYFNMYRVSWAEAFNPEVGFNGTQSTPWDFEWVWDLPFSKDFSPTNPFIKLFANAGGEYLIKPSQKAIDNWAAQTRSSLTPGDIRGTWAVQYQFGQPVAGKYLQNFNPALPFDTKGNWFLARISMIHLRFAEAANRDGHQKLAESFVQRGIRRNFTYPDSLLTTTNPDVSRTQQTFLPAPYDFDARIGDFPHFRAPWHRHDGLRSRAGLQDINLEGATQEGIEDAIIQEAALELAFEGNRWEDLLRIARRRNDPTFLADKVAEKFEKANDPRAGEVRSKLLDRHNWYLPFRWE